MKRLLGISRVPNGGNDELTEFTSSFLSSRQGCLSLALGLQRLIKLLEGYMCVLSGHEENTTKVIYLLLYIM